MKLRKLTALVVTLAIFAGIILPANVFIASAETSNTYTTDGSLSNLLQKAARKPSEAGALQVLSKGSGKTLCDQNGDPIQLRGMSTHGLQWFPGIINDNAFSALSNDWGSNVIRLCRSKE